VSGGADAFTDFHQGLLLMEDAERVVGEPDRI
jgi:hypothetical protein